MFEDSDLRKLLVNFRETVICAEWSGSREHCILRRTMIDHLIAARPRSPLEWRQGLPGYLLRNTEPQHWLRYGPRMTPGRRRAMLGAMNERASTTRRPASYRDVLDAPPELIAELVHGALHLHPRPALRHARASLKLGARLDDPFENGVGGPGGWYFAIEPELHLGPDVLVPDLAGWRRERMGAFPDAPAAAVAPDWVCEILSPATRRFDLTEKRALYGAHRVGHLWLADPETRTLEVFAGREAGWLLLAALAGDDEVRAAPFEAIGFPLSALWPE
jgi:Uma2 family endonuclease